MFKILKSPAMLSHVVYKGKRLPYVLEKILIYSSDFFSQAVCVWMNWAKTKTNKTINKIWSLKFFSRNAKRLMFNDIEFSIKVKNCFDV